MKEYQPGSPRRNGTCRGILGLALAAAALSAIGCGPVSRAALDRVHPAAGLDDPPPALREFRGVWVATVSNIDWPSRPGLTVGEQQAELIAILDRAAELRLNAVVLQVRPAADALYASALEPWSEYLSGRWSPPRPGCGRAPRTCRQVALRSTATGAELSLTPAASGGVWLWTIATRAGGAWSTEIVPGWQRRHAVDPGADLVTVTAIGRTGLESPTARVTPSASAGARAADLPLSRP